MRIPSPERRLDAYPHELSGGLRQRAMIAMALSCSPRLLLADEPTTALDATVQVQVLILLRRLQRELGMGMIFVTHDLGVAAEIADTDRGHVCRPHRRERPGGARCLRAPAHPYTAGLLASTVHGQTRDRDIEAIPGSPPDMRRLPPGCAFAPRCARRMPECRDAVPAPRFPAPGRMAACLAVPEALPVMAEAPPSVATSAMPSRIGMSRCRGPGSVRSGQAQRWVINTPQSRRKPGPTCQLPGVEKWVPLAPGLRWKIMDRIATPPAPP